jgi:hypothetical protein
MATIKIENQTFKTKVVHSQSKLAWNVIGTELGKRYKIARIPYTEYADEILSFRYKQEAFNIADFISYCFNNSKEILKDK